MLHAPLSSPCNDFHQLPAKTGVVIAGSNNLGGEKCSNPTAAGCILEISTLGNTGVKFNGSPVDLFM